MVRPPWNGLEQRPRGGSCTSCDTVLTAVHHGQIQDHLPSLGVICQCKVCLKVLECGPSVMGALMGLSPVVHAVHSEMLVSTCSVPGTTKQPHEKVLCQRAFA